MDITPFTQKESKNIDTLEVEQAVYIPSTTEANKTISPEAFKKRILLVKKLLTKMFGGYTTFSGSGGYYSKDINDVIEEDTIRVVSFSKRENYEVNKKKLLAQLRKWRKLWKQESIGYECEGDLYYIK